MRFRIPAKALQQIRGQPPGSASSEVDPDHFVLEVPPQATDSRIEDWIAPHQVALRRGAAPASRLMVFLSGSYGNPRRQLGFIRHAAALGFHAVNLCYPNRWTVGALCRSSREPGCHERVRLQIIDGEKRTNLVEMRPANSILNRLGKLLQWLDTSHPHDGWNAFLEGEAIHWPSVVVCGHSQGGGHAALIAKQWLVDRVVMLAAPADFDRVLRAPAGWMARAGETPADRHFGFVHRRDPGYDRIVPAWEQMGLAEFGSTVNVGESHPPYQNSHQLVTQAHPALGDRYHASVVVDSATPRASGGAPAFETVWNYLLGSEAGVADG